MADTGDQLLREVEEDLQREQWLRLWNTYGRYAVTAIVLVIVIVAGYMGYQEYRQSQLAADGHSFWVAERNMTLGETDQAVAIFRSLVEDGAEGYPYLAGLRAAEALAASGDRDGALALYDQLSNEQGLEQRYRQLAALYGVMLLVAAPARKTLGLSGSAAAAIATRREKKRASAVFILDLIVI